MKLWENNNAKRALRGSVASSMALSLAACGSDSSDSNDESDSSLTGVGTSETHVIQRVAGEPTLLWDGQFENTNFDNVDLAELFLDNALTAEYIAPVLTTSFANEGVVLGKTTSAADDQVYADGLAMHNAVIDGGAGTDTVYVNMKAPYAQPLAVVNVENLNVVNVENIYALDAAMIAALEDSNSPYIPDSVDSAIDLFKVIDLQSLTISEGSDALGTLAVWNVSSGTALTFAGNFDYDVDVDYMGSLDILDLTFDNVSVDAGTSITVSHNAKTVDLTSTGGGTNDIDGSVFGTQMRVLNVEGNTDFDTTAITFDDNRAATINIGEMTGDTNIEVAAKDAVNYTSGATMTGAETLTLTGDDLSGENRLALDVDMGAGSNTLLINALGAPTYVSGAIDGSADSVTLEIDNAGTVDVTRVADVTSIGKVTFYDAASQLHLTAAQVGEIGIANFETADFVDADGQLVITNVTSTTDLDLSAMDNGNLVAVRTADATDVTLSSTTVLGNLRSGVGEVRIMAESGDASLTMTADQFQQLDGNGTVDVVGIDGTTAGNNPADNTPYEGTLTITGVATGEVLVLDDVDVDGVTVQVGDAGTAFTATSGFSITDGGAPGETVTLEISGTVDLTDATLTGVDAIVLMDGATLTADATDLDGFDISGEGTINVVGASLALNSNGFTYDLDQIDLVFTTAGAVELDVSGDTSITIQSVSTAADVTALTIDNNLDAGVTLTVTGASPAINLHEDTTALTVNAGAGNATVFGTESDDPDTDAVEPAITGSGLTTINVPADTSNGDSTVDLGVVGGVSDTLTINATGFAGTQKVDVQFDTIPASADWTLTNVDVSVNEGATIGTGSSLNLGTGTTIGGTAALGDLPIASDSTLAVTSAYTAAEITTLLDALTGATATVDVTGMATAQLQAVVAADNKVASTSGILIVTADLSAAEITTLHGLADFTAGTNEAYAVLTGMDADQLNAVGGTNEWATDGISGTVTLTADVTAGAIANLLGDATRSATISVDATDMLNAKLSAIATGIASVDTITELTLTAAEDPAEIEALASKSADVTVDAAGMDATDKAELTDVIEKLGSITNLELDAGDDPAIITTLLGSAAVTDATVNATGMDADDIDAVVAGIASVSQVTGYTAESTETVAELSALLGKSTDADAIVVLTGMDADQTDAVIANIANVASFSGEALASGLLAIDAAVAAQVDATGVTEISGTVTELTDIVARQVGVGDAATDNAIQTIDLKADVGLTVTDAAGTTITEATLNDILSAETTGTVTVANAVTITGTQADLTTLLVEVPGGPDTNFVYEDGENGVIAATANLTITDVDTTAITAANLVALGSGTSGTVTVSNVVEITGDLDEMTAALVTAETKVVAATSNLTITGLTAVDVSAQVPIAAIDNATTGTVELQAADGGNREINLTGYNAGALTVTGGDGNDTITVDGANTHTLTGGVGDDTFDVNGGTHTITDLSGLDALQVASGAVVNATVSDDFTANITTANVGGTVTLTVDDDVDVDMTLATVATAATDGYTITASGNAAASTLIGSAAADTITGGDNNDTLTGLAGNDTITGGAGSDTITGGAGADTLVGGSGDDVYVYDGTSEVDAAETITDGSGTADTVKATEDTDFSAMAAANFDDIELVQVVGAKSVTFTGAQLTGETIGLVGDGSVNALVVTATVGGATDLSGISSSLNWTSGTDTVTINAGTGAETITGTQLDDTIVLTSDDEIDTVVFSASNNGADTITGFDADNEDLIDLSAIEGATGAVVTLADTADGNPIIIADTSVALFAAADAGVDGIDAAVKADVLQGLLAIDPQGAAMAGDHTAVFIVTDATKTVIWSVAEDTAAIDADSLTLLATVDDVLNAADFVL